MRKFILVLTLTLGACVQQDEERRQKIREEQILMIVACSMAPNCQVGDANQVLRK